MYYPLLINPQSASIWSCRLSILRASGGTASILQWLLPSLVSFPSLGTVWLWENGKSALWNTLSLWMNIHSDTPHIHHSKRYLNAVQKQCPIVQLPCFRPPSQLHTRLPDLFLSPVCSSNTLDTRPKTHACAQITQQADAKKSVLICKWCLKYRLELLLSHCHAKHVTNGCELVQTQWQTEVHRPSDMASSMTSSTLPMGLHLIFSKFLWCWNALWPRAQRCHGVPQGLKACHKELRHSSLVSVWSKGGSCRFWGHYKFQ